MTTRKPSNADQDGDASIAWRITALKPGQSAFIAKAMATICRKASSLSSMYFSLRARQFGTIAEFLVASIIILSKSVFCRRKLSAALGRDGCLVGPDLFVFKPSSGEMLTC